MQASRGRAVWAALAIVAAVMVGEAGGTTRAGAPTEAPPSSEATPSPSPSARTRGFAPTATLAPRSPLVGASPSSDVGQHSAGSPVRTSTPTTTGDGIEPAANESNLPPTARSDQWFGVPGTPLSFVLNASDPDGDPLMPVILDGPDHGALADCAIPYCTYVPNPSFTGLDTIRWQASDGGRTSPAVTTSLAITEEPVPDTVPEASGDSGRTYEATPVGLTLMTSAVDGSDVPRMDLIVVSPPAHGSLSGCQQHGGIFGCTYTPSAGFIGLDAFEWQVGVGELRSNVATIAITVVPLPSPVAVGGDITVVGDRATTITFVGGPTRGSPVFDVLDEPAHGTLSACEASTPFRCSYTPQPGFRGRDAVTWRWSDGTDWSNPAAVAITVIDDHPPTIRSRPPFRTRERRAVTVFMHAEDRDRDPLTFSIDSQPVHGTLGACRQDPLGYQGCTYLPGAGFVGQELLAWSVTDGASAPVHGIVRIDVRPNRVPRVRSVTLATRERQPVRFYDAASDANDDPLRIVLETRPRHGTVTMWGEYYPDPGFVGTDRFTWRASDGLAQSKVATGTVAVHRNGRPIADSQTVRTPTSHRERIEVMGTDPDGDALGYRLVTLPSHGVLRFSDFGEPVEGRLLVYQPDHRYQGWDRFEFVVNDGLGDSIPATVWIAVGDAGSGGPQSPAPATPSVRPDGQPAMTPPATDATVAGRRSPGGSSAVPSVLATLALVWMLGGTSALRRRRLRSDRP